MNMLFLVPAVITAIIAIAAIVVNMKINHKNRNVNMVTQLSRDFYQDSAFVEARLKLWKALDELSEEDHDYDKIINSIDSSRNQILNRDEIIALNRTAAFYHSVRSLINSKSVDMKMLKSMFGYNYNRFWNRHRPLFEKHSNKDADSMFFKGIEEIED